MTCEGWCPTRGPFGIGEHSDAAKRISDMYAIHRIALGEHSIGKWFAARLSDGTSDGVAYDSKSHAVTHQKHNEQFYTFIMINPGHMTVCEAEVMVRVARKMYDAGLRMTDPDDAHGGKDLIMRSAVEDQLPLLDLQAVNLVWEGLN